MYVGKPIGKWILRLYKHHEKYVSEKLSIHDLKYREANLLMHLFHTKDGINQEELSSDLGVNKATVSRAVTGLLKKDYLQRQRSDKDGRVYLIYLSEKALSLKPEIIEVYEGWFELVTEDIPRQEVDIILKNLEKMYDLVQYQL